MRAEGFALVLLLWVGVPVLAGIPEDVNHLWTFDEGQGFWAVDSLGDRSGVVHGATWVAGRVGAALRFDGVDDYVELPSNDPVWLPINDFTICFWVYCERERGEFDYDAEVLLDLNYGASSNPEHELGYNVQRRSDTGKISFQMTTMAETDEDMYSASVIVEGRWYHVAAAREGATQSIYIDGRLDAQRACSPTPIDFVGTYDDDKVNVGRYTTAWYEPRGHFRGMLDELMIFDRALSARDVRRLYQDGLATCDLYVDAARGSDLHDGLRPFTPLATIQRAVDLARKGDVIGVYPGVYREEIQFLGKAITVRSIGDAAIIEAPDGFGVSFYMGEGQDTVLRNVVIRNCYIGIFCVNSAPTITNVTVTGNVFGAEAYAHGVLTSSCISNSIVWGNDSGDLYGFHDTYCCVGRSPAVENDPWGDWVPDVGLDAGAVRRSVFGLGSFSKDPLFVDAENGDYHVRSARGRYWPAHEVWVLDEVSSPCIDAGDPAADFSAEREPNGGRLNIGAYGGTAYASRSESQGAGDN